MSEGQHTYQSGPELGASTQLMGNVLEEQRYIRKVVDDTRAELSTVAQAVSQIKTEVSGLPELRQNWQETRVIVDGLKSRCDTRSACQDRSSARQWALVTVMAGAFLTGLFGIGLHFIN